MDSSTAERTRRARYSFQYFDKACDVGIENENGERVRKRKKPGRKPNPPSQQERREQNRLAQRNFREREQQRRQERERQWKEYMDELAGLKERLAIAEYESNYLRGWILQLILSSIAQNGTVPQVWVDSRQYPIPHPSVVPPMPFSTGGNLNEAYQLPPILNIVLDDHSRSILSIKKALEMADGSEPSCPLVRRAHYLRMRQQQRQQYQSTDEYQPIPPPPPAVTPCQYKSIQELLTTDIICLNTNSQDIRHTFPAWTPTFTKANTADISNNTKSPESEGQHSLTNNTSRHSPTPMTPVPSSSSVLSSTNSVPDTDSEKLHIRNTSPTINLPDPVPRGIQSPITTVSSIKRTLSVKGTISEPPTLKRPEDLTHMPSIQALHILRLQLKVGSVIGEMIPYALTPTALQRIISHDIRIDYVPSGAIRDRMIIFQDFFDMDECFQLLCSNSIFVGGDIRDSRNWVLDPIITEKYWFFSHHLYDHHFEDCHIPDEFVDELREWTMKRQAHEQQQQKDTLGTDCASTFDYRSNTSLPTSIWR